MTTTIDTILYHFFCKASDLIIEARLPPATSEAHKLTESDADLAQQLLFALDSTTTRDEERASWFGLGSSASSGSRLFAQELQLWRSSSQLVAQVATGTEQNQLPEMVLDILLDPSSLANQGQQDERVLLKRTAEDQCYVVTSAPSTSAHRTAAAPPLIPLERWKVAIEPQQHDVKPPTPEQIYTQCAACLHQLKAAVGELPAATLARQLFSSSPCHSDCSTSTSDRAGSHQQQSSILRLGIQLSPSDDPPREETGELGVGSNLDAYMVPLDRYLGASGATAPAQTEVGEKSAQVARTKEFDAVRTGLGTLRISLQYRVETNYSIETLSHLRTEQERAIEEMIMTDEDYFRFRPTVQAKRNSRGGSPLRGTVDLPGAQTTGFGSGTGWSSPNARSGVVGGGLTSSLKRHPSITSLQQQSASVGGGGGATASGSGTGGGPSTSAFSSSPTSRPVAGLAALRGPVAIPARGTSTSGHGYPTPPSIASPTLAAAMSGSPEPAFLRRDTTGSSSSGTTGGLGSALSTREFPSPSATGRASLHSPLSLAGGGIAQSLRTGSYSPSSPSPLAQEMSLQALHNQSQQQQHQQQYLHRRSSARAPSSLGRSSTLELSDSSMGNFPSLRSVFSGYGSGNTALAAVQMRGSTSYLSSPRSAASTSAPASSRPIPVVNPAGANHYRGISRTAGGYASTNSSSSFQHHQHSHFASSSFRSLEDRERPVDEELDYLVHLLERKDTADVGSERLLANAGQGNVSSPRHFATAVDVAPGLGRSSPRATDVSEGAIVESQLLSRQRIDSLLDRMALQVGRFSAISNAGGAGVRCGLGPSLGGLGSAASGTDSVGNMSRGGSSREEKDGHRHAHRLEHRDREREPDRDRVQVSPGQASILEESPHEKAVTYEETAGPLEM